MCLPAFVSFGLTAIGFHRLNFRVIIVSHLHAVNYAFIGCVKFVISSKKELIVGTLLFFAALQPVSNIVASII